jgi:hypothetical protein
MIELLLDFINNERKQQAINQQIAANFMDQSERCYQCASSFSISEEWINPLSTPLMGLCYFGGGLDS